MHSAVNDLIFPAAKAVGDGHAAPTDQANEEIDQQTGNGTGSTHRGDVHAPQNCPTTTRSAALKSSCKTLVRIMGMVNRMIFGNRGPSSMFLFVWFK